MTSWKSPFDGVPGPAGPEGQGRGPAAMTLLSRLSHGACGRLAGDAVGTTVEFSQRGTLLPLTDMIGDSPFGLAPGQWTGDTSMALCLLADRLRRHEAGG